MGYGESAWRIPVKVNGVDLSAVVDTAAEITILSESVYGSMSPRPKVLSHVDVNLAGGKQYNRLILLGQCRWR